MLFQRFCKEVVLWSSLSHPNVMKISGIQGDMGKGQFVIVSEWMAQGSIMEYIKKNHVNRLELVCSATFPPLPSFNSTVVARGSSGSGIPPWRWYHSREPQRGWCHFISRQITFLTFNRRTSSFQMTRPLVPASRTSVLRQLPLTLVSQCRAAGN